MASTLSVARIPVITPAMIQDARSLDVNGQVRLGEVITPSNYNLDILDAYLYHLLPERLYISALPHVEQSQLLLLRNLRNKAAWCAGAIALPRLLQDWCPPDHPLRETTVTKILAHFPGIILWFEALRPQCRNLEIASLALKIFMKADNRLQEALLMTRLPSATALAALLQKDATGLPRLSKASRVSTELFAMCLCQEDYSRRVLVNLLTKSTADWQSQDALTEWAECMIFRIDNLFTNNLDVPANSSTLSDLQDEQGLLQNITTVGLELCRQHPLILESLLGSRYLQACVWALRKLMRQLDRHTHVEKKADPRRWVFFSLGKILQSLGSPGTSRHKLFVRVFNSLIECGLVDLLVEGLQMIQQSDASSDFEGMEWLISKVSTLSRSLYIYPSICAAVARRLHDISPKIQLSALRPESRISWRWLEVDVDVANELQAGSRTRISLCDSFQCTQLDEATETNARANSKTCSGCRSVVYCSDACQRDDWQYQHREECKEAKKNIRDLGDARYSHRLRDFHAKFLCAMMNLLPSVWRSNGGLASGPTIWTMDGMSDPIPTEHDMESYPYKHRLQIDKSDDTSLSKPNDTEDDLHYFDRRVEKLMEEFAMDGGRIFQLVEVVQQFGDKDVLVMVKLQKSITKQGLEKFTVFQTVARIGPLLSSTRRTSVEKAAKPAYCDETP